MHLDGSKYCWLKFENGTSTQGDTTGAITAAFYGYKEGTTSIINGNNDESNLKRTDYGINFGIGLEYKSMYFSLQKASGIPNLSPGSLSKATGHNRVFSIAVCFLIGE